MTENESGDTEKEPEAGEAPGEATEAPGEPSSGEPGAGEPGAEGAQAQSADVAPPGLEEMREWRGHRLDDMHGTKTAKVVGVFADLTTRVPQWLLIRVGLFGHHTAVPATTAVAAGGHVWVPHTRDEIRRAPKLDPDKELTAQGERELLGHYGLMGDTGRAAEIASREASSPTAGLVAPGDRAPAASGD